MEVDAVNPLWLLRTQYVPYLVIFHWALQKIEKTQVFYILELKACDSISKNGRFKKGKKINVAYVGK